MNASLERPYNATADKANFWQSVWSGGECSTAPYHPLRGFMESIICRFDLLDGRILEVGCGAGGMQKLSSGYVCTDFSPACGRYMSPGSLFIAGSATQLPFRSGSFDLVFSIYVLEHIQDAGAALTEIRRVTKPGGLVLVKPAWFCRPWTGREWFHKPADRCTLFEHVLRQTVRLRNSLIWRAAHLLQWRLRGYFAGPMMRYRKLRANYDMPQVIDSDAEIWLDPLDVIRWFHRHGDECVSHPDWKSQWLRTSDALIFRIAGSER